MSEYLAHSEFIHWQTPSLLAQARLANAEGLTVAQTSESAASRIGNPQDIEHRFAAATVVIASSPPTVHWQRHNGMVQSSFLKI